jgi:ankyrin repeat protein
VEGGADVDARESAWGQTPLMWAASLNRVEAVQALLKGGADPSLTTRVLEFTQAARTGRTGRQVRDSMFAAFRSKSANPSLWRPDPSEVQAALRAAREHDSVEPVEPGHIARIDWDSAQIAGRSPSASDEAGYQGGLTALLHAVREGNTEAAIALLEGGADVNQRGTGDLGTPLLRAMQNGHFDLGLELLRRGADPTLVNHPNEMTPLYAVINTQWASKSRYPQQQAYRQQKVTHLETMEALLEAGADPNARLALDYWFLGYNFGGVGVDFWGATPFFRAAHALDVPAMKLLVRYGADPNIPTKARANDRPGDLAEVTPAATDQSGLPPVQGGDPAMYPIHAAAGNAGGGAARADNFHTHVRDGWLPAVKYLVEELGADVGLRDSAGYGTIHGAAGRGHLEVVRYLLDKGADPFVLARSGVTAIDIANGPADGTVPFPEIIALLEGMGVVNNHVCVTVGSC